MYRISESLSKCLQIILITKKAKGEVSHQSINRHIISQKRYINNITLNLQIYGQTDALVNECKFG